jgi:hypothetical protein
MHLRVVTKAIDTYVNQPVALSLLALPFVVGVAVDGLVGM